MGPDAYMIELRKQARSRNDLIERARLAGVRALPARGYTNAGKVTLDLETFRRLLDALSHLEPAQQF